VEQLGAAGSRRRKKPLRRVIIENHLAKIWALRPLSSTRGFLKVLSGSQVYRMDHFLGRRRPETSWCCASPTASLSRYGTRDHIDHVQITVAETSGVKQRAKFYEATGGIADMCRITSSSFSALLRWAPPNSFAADAVTAGATV